MLPIPLSFRVLVLAAALAAQLHATPARACGGCFSPPTPEITQTVVQNAERVLFLRDPLTKLSTVWVEVRYSGLAKDFGWVLPVPKLPTVGVGSVAVFDALDQGMAMRYALQYGADENCRSAFDGCVEGDYTNEYAPGEAGDASSSDTTASADAGSVSGGPGVQVLSQGSTGPYDYVVVQSAQAQALYDWLTSHGYALPDKAKPIIQSHIDQGNVFVAVHLQNGQGVEAIRPITLAMNDSDPCVPLRLTSIAAADELSVVVTIAGAGRAVPKNHLAVEPNPLRLTLGTMNDSVGSILRPSNFDQVVAGAIDEAGGRAFVTESAMSGVTVAQSLSNTSLKSFESGFTNVSNLMDLASALNGVPITAELADTFGPLLKLDGVLPGVPTLQALADLQACAIYWYMPASPACDLPGLTQPLTQAGLMAVPVDGAALTQAFVDDLVKPVDDVIAQLAASPTITRLAMRISPNEMDRDPIFAFNPSLPLVDPTRQIATNQVCSTGWYTQDPNAYDYGYGYGNADLVRYTIDGLGSWVFATGTEPPQDPRFKTAPLALSVQVLEESGKPIDIAPSDVPVVSAAIAGAKPGTASLPANLLLQTGTPWLPPPSDMLVDKLTPWHKPVQTNAYYTCTPKPCWVDGQLPPASCGVAPDAGSGLPDAGSADQDVKSGPVPGVDSANGWTGADVAGASAGTGNSTTQPGCTASARASAPTPLLLLTLALLLLVRRRQLATA